MFHVKQFDSTINREVITEGGCGLQIVFKQILCECKKITTKSTDVAGTADGGYTVTVYAWISGKSQKLGTARVNTKKQFTVKIKKQKKNTVLKIVSKDRYGNAVSVNYTVK